MQKQLTEKYNKIILSNFTLKNTIKEEGIFNDFITGMRVNYELSN